MGKVRNVDTTSSHISGDDNADGFVPHFVQDVFSLFLRKVTMQRFCVIPTVHQLTADFITLDLGPTEYNSVEAFFHIDDTGQCFELVRLSYLDVNLIGEVAGWCLLLDLYHLRVVHEPTSKTLDWCRHGSRETEHPLVFGCLFQNFLDILNKSHIKHFISFVQNNELKLIQLEGTSSEVVKNTTGGYRQLHVHLGVAF